MSLDVPKTPTSVTGWGAQRPDVASAFPIVTAPLLGPSPHACVHLGALEPVTLEGKGCTRDVQAPEYPAYVPLQSGVFASALQSLCHGIDT